MVLKKKGLDNKRKRMAPVSEIRKWGGERTRKWRRPLGRRERKERGNQKVLLPLFLPSSPAPPFQEASSSSILRLRLFLDPPIPRLVLGEEGEREGKEEKVERRLLCAERGDESWRGKRNRRKRRWKLSCERGGKRRKCGGKHHIRTHGHTHKGPAVETSGWGRTDEEGEGGFQIQEDRIGRKEEEKRGDREDGRRWERGRGRGGRGEEGGGGDQVSRGGRRRKKWKREVVVDGGGGGGGGGGGVGGDGGKKEEEGEEEGDSQDPYLLLSTTVSREGRSKSASQSYCDRGEEGERGLIDRWKKDSIEERGQKRPRTQCRLRLQIQSSKRISLHYCNYLG